MAEQNLEWMTQGPLTLPSVMHKISRDVEKLLMKYDPKKIVKAEDHLDTFYLHLQTLEVRYNEFSCKLFPCALDGRAAVWCHNLPPNSI